MFIFLFSIAVSLQGQVRLEADTIALGDQTTVVMPADATLLPPQEVLVLSQHYDSVDATLHTVVTCFEPGIHWLHLGDGDSLPLVVTDVEVDTANAEIRDIAPIQRVPYTFWEIFRWVLLVLAVAAAAFAIWWLLRHRQRIQQVLGMAPPIDTRTPEERALEALEALRRRQLWQAGNGKEYHTELTDIVRRFIEEATGIRATEMTSGETVEEIDKLKLDMEMAPLRDIFTMADLVKFAKSEPLPHEHESSMTEAVQFVKAMWLCVKPVEEKNEKGETKNGKEEMRKEGETV